MAYLRTLLQTVEHTNRRYHLLKRGDSLVVGVSGGPDSMALLALLMKMRRKYALRILVAHLDHGLRGPESLRQRAVVKDFCLREKLPFFAKAVRVRERARKKRLSLEEAGRLERYRFFGSVARRLGAQKIVTAHTLDDQAETVLLRILRGSGLRGLAGIPFKRREGRFTVVRPLLLIQKKDLLAFLKESRVPFCVDRTNRDTFFTRNRVRHKLLPELEKLFNPRIKESLSSLQAVAAHVQDFMDRAARRALKRCLSSRRLRQKVSLRLDPLRRLHPALLHEVLLEALAQKKGDRKGFSHAHIAAVTDLVRSPQTGLQTHLPGVRIKKTRRTLDFHLK